MLQSSDKACVQGGPLCVRVTTTVPLWLYATTTGPLAYVYIGAHMVKQKFVLVVVKIFTDSNFEIKFGVKTDEVTVGARCLQPLRTLRSM
jgi:hypothetical protein